MKAGIFVSTIKDVAKRAGVSPTTVSIILNGKAEDRKISQATLEKVMNAVRDLDYQPNLSARRLRSNEIKKPSLAFFWPSDHRTNIMATFINYIQEELIAHQYDCELVIQTYQNDHLDEKASIFAKNSYNAMIIGASSLDDVEFLENTPSQSPVILINRTSALHSTISVDDKAVGREAARLLYDKGYREAALLAGKTPYVATGVRTKAFLTSCKELGIKADIKYLLYQNRHIQMEYPAAAGRIGVGDIQ